MPRETLKIASPIRGSWEGAIPELGKQAGIFQKHGLDLEILYTQGGGETMQVVVSGSVDVGLSAGMLGTLGAYAKGAPVRIIARELDRVAGSVLVGRRQIAAAGDARA